MSAYKQHRFDTEFTKMAITSTFSFSWPFLLPPSPIPHSGNLHAQQSFSVQSARLAKADRIWFARICTYIYIYIHPQHYPYPYVRFDAHRHRRHTDRVPAHRR